MSELRFDGRVAVITGAGRGLGRSYALLLAARGCKVVVNDNGSAIRGDEVVSNPADDVVAEIVAAGGEAVACRESVATPQGCAAIVQAAIDAWGRIDVLIHNAGNTRFDDFAEITTEANPDNVDHAYLATLAEAGFTRVSFGMQSAITEVLKTLERTHKPENVPVAVGAAKQAGLGTSVDLIYGAPGETMEQWQQTVDRALELETDHISAYALIVEPGTKLARQIRSGELAEPDDDLTADKYEYLDAALSAAGFEWYELSNFSRDSKTRSAHNLAYWNTQDWWGYGPGAHSHVGGVRWWNQKHPTGYAAALAEGVTPAAGRELLSDTTRLEERLLLELRLRSGLAIEVVKAINPKATGVVATLIADGLVEASAALAGSLVLTLKGRLLADAVVRRLI